MIWGKTLALTLVFLLGMSMGLYAARASEQPWDAAIEFAQNPLQSAEPKATPRDRVSERAIEVYGDRVILDIRNAQWSTFTNTHSMEPLIFQGANAIQIEPKGPEDVQVGDIVSYRSEFAQGTIIHRVVYKGEDEDGTYYIMKGDNLATSDPGRVRFNQIERVTVAVIY